jgi:hypothetical protein
MKLSKLAIFVALASSVITQGLHAASWSGYQIAQLEAPDPARPCLFFTLVGVPQADPAFPNDPWFAISENQSGYWEIYGMLLLAKSKGLGVAITTSGQAAAPECDNLGNHVGVNYIVLP